MTDSSVRTRARDLVEEFRHPVPEQFLIPLVRQIVSRPKLAAMFGRLDKFGNPFEEQRYIWPYPVLERMRAEGPLVYHPLYQNWFITGYEASAQVLSSPDMVTGPQIETLMKVRPYSQLSDWTRQFMANQLVFTDPPQHDRLRSLVARAFTPRQMARLETRVESLAHEMLDAVADDPEPDLFASLAQPLPINMISFLLGIPEDRWEWMSDISKVLVKVVDPFTSFDPAEMEATVQETRQVLTELADERRRNPTDDVISTLVTANEEGDQLTMDELVAVTTTILFAGHETTTGLLCTSMLALAQHPEQRALVQADPELWPTAVEELIRWDTSVQMIPRSAAADVKIGDKVIAKGDNVLVVLAMANRDPAEYDRPNELDLTRTGGKPLGFGHGIHYCLGQALARMELRIGLRAVIDRFGDYTIDESKVEWRQVATLRSPTTLPVKRGQQATTEVVPA